MAYLEIPIDRAMDTATWPDCCSRCTAGGTSLVPVPRRYTKGLDGLAVPLCPAHADDWAVVRYRNRIASVVVGLAMVAICATAWILHPHFAEEQDQNSLMRAVRSFMIGFVSVLPMGIVGGMWAKTPIRVGQRNSRLLTLFGVSRRFAKRVREALAPAPLPRLDEAVQFEVDDYRPVPHCPPGKALTGLAITAAVGGLFGAAIGLAGPAIEEQIGGWPKNDWRYLALAAVALIVYVVPLFSLRMLFSRFSLVLLPVALLGLAVALVVLRLIGLPLKYGFAAVMSLGPLVLLYVLVISPVIWRWRIRSAPVAVLIGASGPLMFLAGVYLVGGLAPGPHQVAYYLGVFALVLMPFRAGNTSQSPACAECTGWLDGRRIGSLPRGAAEIKPVLASGQVISLAELTPYPEKATIGDCELKVFSCSHCRDHGTVVVELFDCRPGGKNGRTPFLVKVGRWRYPGPALLVIEKLFPGPNEKGAAPAEEPA